MPIGPFEWIAQRLADEMVAQATVNDARAEWLKTRPECVQKLAAEFPIGSVFQVDGKPPLYLLGWTEEDTIIVSEIDPCEDYEAAHEAKQYLCASHFRETLQ